MWGRTAEWWGGSRERPLPRECRLTGDNGKDEEVMRNVVKAGQIRELNYCPE